jgi:hypothetical protein
MIEDIIRSVLGMPPGANKINRDLEAMREMARPVMTLLIPWEEEKELELMSLRVDYKSQKKGFDKVLMGTVQSIYFEPMVVFSYLKYDKKSREALLYCRTVNREIVFRIKKRDVDVYLNGSHVAIINQHNILYGVRSKSALGQVRHYSADLLSIFIREKDVGHLFNPLRPHSDVQRAFYLIADLNEEEEGIFLTLGLFELITRTLSNKKKK